MTYILPTQKDAASNLGRFTATITLAADHERLQFTIADDGEGFDPHLAAVESRGRSDSFGLQATHERAEQLGGSLSIDSHPGEGTQLTIELTLEQTT